MSPRLHRFLPVLALALGALAACGSSSSTSGAASSSTTIAPTATTAQTTTARTTAPVPVTARATTAVPGSASVPITGEVVVFAASSLTESFTTLAKGFEAAHPGTKVTLSFGASSTLAQQVIEGAPADVFAAADTTTMKKLTDANQAGGQPVVFARNRLAIIVPKGNPKKITGLGDLAQPGVIVALCAETVPCGSFAKQALAKAGVTVTPKSFEDNVKGVVTKAQLGEIDAGIVYATDVQASAGKAEGVSIPDAQNVIASYPIVQTARTAHRAAAKAFLDYATGADGLATLATAGFLAPT